MQGKKEKSKVEGCKRGGGGKGARRRRPGARHKSKGKNRALQTSPSLEALYPFTSIQRKTLGRFQPSVVLLDAIHGRARTHCHLRRPPPRLPSLSLPQTRLFEASSLISSISASHCADGSFTNGCCRRKKRDRWRTVVGKWAGGWVPCARRSAQSDRRGQMDAQK